MLGLFQVALHLVLLRDVLVGIVQEFLCHQSQMRCPNPVMEIADLVQRGFPHWNRPFSPWNQLKNSTHSTFYILDYHQPAIERSTLNKQNTLSLRYLDTKRSICSYSSRFLYLELESSGSEAPERGGSVWWTGGMSHVQYIPHQIGWHTLTLCIYIPYLLRTDIMIYPYIHIHVIVVPTYLDACPIGMLWSHRFDPIQAKARLDLLW